MIFNSRSNYMLKYEKAKAKLVEFNIERKDYPHFQLDSDDLVYTTLFVLSRYCEELIKNPNSKEISDLFSELSTVSQYYDATTKATSWRNYDNLFLLLGSTSYFLAENFGSAKVLIKQIANWSYDECIISVLYKTLYFLLLNKECPISLHEENYIQYFNAVSNHFIQGAPEKVIYNSLDILREQVYQSQDVFGITYIDLLYGISICAIKHSAWILLPKYSEIDMELWKEYLLEDKSIKLLWPAQKIILETGVLKGQNIVVPLPTGVGKTKSIELLLRSVFMNAGTCVAVIIAPLRALCNEITSDLSVALNSKAVINQFTDTAQEDFNLELLINTKYIFICTPEKFSYILRHEPEFIEAIRLFIFDEAHLFDDDTRGAQYELLVSEIARSRRKDSQMVLFSAVLSNANQIGDWLFHSNDATINYSLVKSTEKTIGFLSSDYTLHYYEKDEMSKESFYVPKSIKTVQLKLRPKEHKERVFPEKNPQDLAIYYAVNLCKQNGAAIFAGQARSILPIMRRIVELGSRGYDLSNLTKFGNAMQMDNLHKLFLLHYGKNSELTKAIKIGALPHYANLPNGIKMAIEYALRKRHIYLVVCTTTLAEGVNIPIKYLILTTFSYGDSKLQIRKMQNLIGRTARSGVHTEGSAIVTDSKYFDNRSNWRGGGKYQWNDCKKMFDYSSAEACTSAILRLVSELQVDYKNKYRGDSLATYLIKNYKASSCFSNLQEELKRSYKKRVTEDIYKKYSYIIDRKVEQLKRIVEGIENYLCFIYSIQNEYTQFVQTARNLVSLTFAFYLANNEQKKNLEKMFQVIAEKICDEIQINNIPYFAKSLYGINVSRHILQWTDENISMLSDCSSDEILLAICELFISLFPEQMDVHKKDFIAILNKWNAGKLYIDIYDELSQSVPLNQIEKICAKTISYNLSFLIGNIIDAIGERDDKLIDSLTLLQKQVKYGVSTRFRVLVCENIFDERYLSYIIENTINSTANVINEKQLKRTMQANSKDILTLLKDFPEYFSHRFKEYITEKKDVI